MPLSRLIRIPARLITSALICAATIVICGSDAGQAQSLSSDSAGQYTVNLRDVDIRALAEQVARVTGRTLVLDPQVSGSVTVLSSTPLDSDGVWDLFQSVLQLNGFSAQQSGSLWRVTRLDTAKEGGPITDNGAASGRFDVITRLIRLENFPAATAAEAFRPLIASFGYLEAVPNTNTLIVTDTAENVEKIEQIARTLDSGGTAEVLTIPIRNADAAELGAAIQAVLGPVSETGVGPRIIVDDASNSLILRGDASARATVEQLVRELDIKSIEPPANEIVARVYRLRHADAPMVAEMLQDLIGGGGSGFGADPNNPVSLALDAEDPAATADTGGAGQGAGAVSVQAVAATNSVVVRATISDHADIAQLLAKLDTQRPQILIEAAIVEVSGDVSEKLGTQLGFGAATPPGGFAGTSFSGAGPALTNILALLGVSEARAMAPSGLSVGIARSDEYGILIQALGQSTKANLLSTPSLTTLDNQPAEIIVGQNVPFRTGSFNTDGTGNNPFTTIERQDVGITMRVVPRVADGNLIQLDISQEVSSLTDTAVDGAADLITNRRSIRTTVVARNGGTIVLGGLISDDSQSVRAEVPGLGKLPLVGGLFRNNSTSRRKQTLYVFLRATILNSSQSVSEVSQERFLRLRSIEAEIEAPAKPAQPRNPVKRMPVEIDGLY